MEKLLYVVVALNALGVVSSFILIYLIKKRPVVLGGVQARKVVMVKKQEQPK